MRTRDFIYLRALTGRRGATSTSLSYIALKNELTAQLDSLLRSAADTSSHSLPLRSR